MPVQWKEHTFGLVGASLCISALVCCCCWLSFTPVLWGGLYGGLTVPVIDRWTAMKEGRCQLANVTDGDDTSDGDDDGGSLASSSDNATSAGVKFKLENRCSGGSSERRIRRNRGRQCSLSVKVTLFASASVAEDERRTYKRLCRCGGTCRKGCESFVNGPLLAGHNFSCRWDRHDQNTYSSSYREILIRDSGLTDYSAAVWSVAGFFLLVAVILALLGLAFIAGDLTAGKKKPSPAVILE